MSYAVALACVAALDLFIIGALIWVCRIPFRMDRARTRPALVAFEDDLGVKRVYARTIEGRVFSTE